MVVYTELFCLTFVDFVLASLVNTQRLFMIIIPHLLSWFFRILLSMMWIYIHVSNHKVNRWINLRFGLMV